VLIVDILSCAGWKGWQEEKAGEERQAEGCDVPAERSLSAARCEAEFEHRKVRERRLSTVSAGAGGVVGGVVAVIVKVCSAVGEGVKACPNIRREKLNLSDCTAQDL
jgi:hypothetical protein